MAVVVVVGAARDVAVGPVGVVGVTVAVAAGVAADGATAVLSGAVLADPAAHMDVLGL